MSKTSTSHATKESILALAGSTQIERIEVAELNSPIYIRGLSARERDSFEASCMPGKGKARALNMENIRARLLVRSICNEVGARLFQDHEADALGTVPASVVDKLFSVAQRLSGLSTNDVEELAGN